MSRNRINVDGDRSPNRRMCVKNRGQEADGQSVITNPAVEIEITAGVRETHKAQDPVEGARRVDETKDRGIVKVQDHMTGT